MITRNSWRWLFALVSLGIALVTLTPAHIDETALTLTPWWCIVCGNQGFVDVLLNVALFVPLGFTLRQSGFGLRAAVGTAMAATILIESAQGVVIPGRDASLSDILTNTSGALLGAWVSPFAGRLLRPSPQLSVPITVLGSALFVAQAVGAVFLFSAAPLDSPTYTVQWGRVFPGTVPFRGEILSAQSEGLRLPPGPMDSSRTLRDRLATAPSSFTAEVRGAPQVSARAQIVAVHDGNTNVVVWINQNRCSIEFRLRLAPANLRLTYPAVSTPIPCDLETNRLQLRGEITRTALSVRVTDLGSGEVWVNSLSRGPNLTWSYLVPGSRGYHDTTWPSAAWAFVWMAVLAYAAYFNARLRWRLLPASAAVIVMIGVPLGLDLPPVSFTEWVGAAVGGMAGWCTARILKRMQPAT